MTDLHTLHKTLKAKFKSNYYHTQLSTMDDEITIKMVIGPWMGGNGFHALCFVIKKDIGKLYLSINLGVETSNDGFQYLAGWQLADSFETRLAAKSIGLPEYLREILKRNLHSGIKSIKTSLAKLQLTLSNNENLKTSCSGMLLDQGKLLNLAEWITELLTRNNPHKRLTNLPNTQMKLIAISKSQGHYKPLEIKTYEQLSMESKRQEQCDEALSGIQSSDNITIENTGKWVFIADSAQLELEIKRDGQTSSFKTNLCIKFKPNSSEILDVTLQQNDNLSIVA